MNRAADAIIAALSEQSSGGARASRDAELAAAARRRLAQHRVSGNAADDGERAGAGRLDGLGRPLDQGADDRRLIGGGQVGGRAAAVANGAGERGLQAAEREVVAGAAHHRRRKGVRGRVAARRQLLEGRAARIAEPEQAGALVERLARRVVEAAPDHRHVAARLDRREQRVPARREQRQERRLHRVGLADRGRRRARADGSPGRAAGGGRTRAPWRPRARRAARRSGPGPR